jgi:hypothetical protein
LFYLNPSLKGARPMINKTFFGELIALAFVFAAGYAFMVVA